MNFHNYEVCNSCYLHEGLASALDPGRFFVLFLGKNLLILSGHVDGGKQKFLDANRFCKLGYFGLGCW